MDLSVYFVLVVVTSFTPGAGVLYTITNAFRYGKQNAWKSPIGNTIGNFLMSVVSATGLGGVIVSSPALFTVIQSIGVLVLIYFGYQNWTAPTVDLSTVSTMKDEKSTWHIIYSAAALQATNPMLIVFLLSLLPQFIDPKAPYVSQVSILIAIFVLTCCSVHFIYSYTASALAIYLKGKRFSYILNHLSAVLFWLVAATILWKTYFL